jgi:hypothetical protein
MRNHRREARATRRLRAAREPPTITVNVNAADDETTCCCGSEAEIDAAALTTFDASFIGVWKFNE